MPESLQRRILAIAQNTLTSYPGAWLVWCDPRGDWLPLVEHAAASPSNGFTLLALTDETAGRFGSPQARQQLQEYLDAGQSFVLVVPQPADNLGWLWAHALLAECIVDRSLRERLRDWGWRPATLTMSDEEVAALARRNLDKDPTTWGGGGLQPDIPLLLSVLAGMQDPVPEQQVLLELTTEQAGLPSLTGSDLAGWRARSLAHLLVTEAHHLAPGSVGEGNEYLIDPGRREFALRLLAAWADSIALSKQLAQAILHADKLAGLATALAGVRGLPGPFLSRAAEQAIFVATCRRLAGLPGPEALQQLADMGDDIRRHALGFWGHGHVHDQPIPWDELGRLSQAARSLIEATPELPWDAPREAIDWYTGGGWRLDQAGQEFMRDLARPTPDLLTLIAPLRAAYRARWEQTMIEWSATWLRAGCPAPALSSAGEWLVVRLQDKRPTAILVIDALRYDLGSQLAQRIDEQEGTARAKVFPARAPLPSITALGMGMALPVPEGELRAELSGGKWQLFFRNEKGDLAVAEKRRAWWQQRGGVAAQAILDLSAVQSDDLPKPAPGLTRLVITDATIDKMGHDDQLEVQGGGFALDRYTAAIERLRDAGWLRILVVTDHGFIHWPSSTEKNAPRPLDDPAYASRRALAYPATAHFEGPQGLAPGGRWRIAVPHGAASFRAYGGLGYFHGGASLQEWIIPCLAVEWPLQARPVQVELVPLPKVLSQKPRVTVRIVPLSLLIEEAIARTVEIIVRNAESLAILMRSGPVKIRPDQADPRVALEPVPGLSTERGTGLRIELRDARTEEVLHAIDSVLSIELSEW